MKKDKNIRSYSAETLKAHREKSRTDWQKVDALTDRDLKRLIASDKDEKSFHPDWTKAKLVYPQAKQSVHLRLEQDVIDYYRSLRHGRGHISMMQAVLRSYVDSHRTHAE